jgi:hypothetical protein
MKERKFVLKASFIAFLSDFTVEGFLLTKSLNYTKCRRHLSRQKREIKLSFTPNSKKIKTCRTRKGM